MSPFQPTKGSGGAENGFWRILKAAERLFLYLYDKIWGGGFALVSPIPNSGGTCFPCPPMIYAHGASCCGSGGSFRPTLAALNLCVRFALFHNKFTVYGFVYWFVQFSRTDEGFLAERVTAMVKSQDLPLAIKTLTRSNDNCFFRALCDLLQEPYIRRGLSDEVLSAGSDHLQLRQAVIDFLGRLDEEGYNVLFNTEKAKVIQVLECNFVFS